MQRTPEMRALVTLIRDKLIDGNSEEIEIRMPHSNPELELFGVWLWVAIEEGPSIIRAAYRIKSNKIDCRCCDDKVCYLVKGRDYERNFFSFKTAPKAILSKFQLDENGNRVGEGKPVISELSGKRMDPEEILEKMMDIIEGIEEEVNSLMIEKRNGVFINTKSKEAMDENIMIELTAKAFAHAKYNPYGEPCCVCNVITETKTRCGHHLCMHCWNSLVRPVCPMCREDVDEFGGCDSDDD